MTVAIRRALPEDAAAVTAVVRRSITELCGADHGNDPERLEAWLANKTVANVSAWIASPRYYCVVATTDAVVCGVRPR